MISVSNILAVAEPWYIKSSSLPKFYFSCLQNCVFGHFTLLYFIL